VGVKKWYIYIVRKIFGTFERPKTSEKMLVPLFFPYILTIGVNPLGTLGNSFVGTSFFGPIFRPFFSHYKPRKPKTSSNPPQNLLKTSVSLFSHVRKNLLKNSSKPP
jgi:hypothetical protein